MYRTEHCCLEQMFKYVWPELEQPCSACLSRKQVMMYSYIWKARPSAIWSTKGTPRPNLSNSNVKTFEVTEKDPTSLRTLRLAYMDRLLVESSKWCNGVFQSTVCLGQKWKLSDVYWDVPFQLQYLLNVNDDVQLASAFHKRGWYLFFPISSQYCIISKPKNMSRI